MEKYIYIYIYIYILKIYFIFKLCFKKIKNKKINILSKSTFESQNILPKVDFWKSKYITESQLSKVKI